MQRRLKRMKTDYRHAPALLGVVAALLTSIAAWAQPAPAASAPAAPRPAAAASSSAQRVPATQPAPTKAWNELSSLEQKALQPLAANWNGIDAAQKRKWQALSKNFHTMPPAEQARLHSRMSEWATLSPKQRTEARLNFAETTKVPADEKLAKWQAYQALSLEERNKLAASAPRPAGAAPAVRPVPPQKLATPVHPKPPDNSASGAATKSRQVDQNTLLPRKPASSP